jgi:N-acetylmuramoyl-L-alanine amidase
MRGVFLRPDTETGIIPEESLDDLSLLGMNTAIIETSAEEAIFYSTNMNKSASDEPDRLSIAIDSAKRRGLNVFLTFDINTVLYADSSHDMQAALNSLISELHKFTLKYYSDGIILTNYYSSKGEESFKHYMGFGAGIGYSNWLYESTESFFSTAANTIRLTDNAIPVGILLNSFAAITADTYFADTRAFIENGHADFAVVNAPDPISSSAMSLPFEDLVTQWGKICTEGEIPMYIIHHNQKIGRSDLGADWNRDDQLLRQLSVASKLPAYQGSVFYSHSDLMENRLKSTENIQKFFNAQINEDTLFDNLIMQSPSRLSFSTNDAFAVFQGTYDDNFEVTLNNEVITLNEAGNFYIEKPLSVGMNYFTLTHKGQVITYTIDRRIHSLHSIDSSIAEGRVLEVEGGTNITISAIAYRGAVVTATINNQTIQLTQQDYALDDAALNTSYAPFVGRYTVPAGRINQAQNLGTITVSANYSGFRRSATGASIRIIALPEPPPPVPPPVVDLIDQNNAGTGEVVGTISAIRSSDTATKLLRITNDRTYVFCSKTTGLSGAFDPTLSQLPAGTIDYFRATVGDFHTTDSGRRIRTGDSSVIDGYGMGDNSLVVISSGNSGRNSYFQIKLDHRSTFNITPADLKFSTRRNGMEFQIENFNPTHIHIDFDNVTSVTKLPSFENNHIFSGGRWETPTINGVPKFRLVLELRRRGVYFGHHARYDSEGDLMLTFPALSGSLSGKRIVIDPGHGINANGRIDPGAVGHIIEWDANIAVARALRDRLTALGATANILPTYEKFISARGDERTNYARNLGCDLFISIHSNAVGLGNPNVRGQEAYYFNPWSQPLASAISQSMATYFRDNVYADKTMHNRGAKYSYFWVTLPQDYPAVLLELGFVANLEDAMALSNETHQRGIANAIAEGIQRYLNR